MNKGKRKILIINFDKDMSDILEMIFIHQRYQVDICNSLANIEALHLNKKPDVIILGRGCAVHHDLLRAYQMVRANRKSTEVPIIHLSATAEFAALDDQHLQAIAPLNFRLLSQQVKALLARAS